MPHVNDKTYDELAKQAVDAYIDNDTPLTDSVYKIAEDVGMLPDQVKQLTWRANTLAHLTLFDKKAEDKNVEFQVADAEDVLSRLYNNTEEKTAQAYTKHAKDRTLDYFITIDAAGLTKEAAEDDDTVTPPFSGDLPRYRGETRTTSVFVLQKVAEELENSALMARENFLSSMLSLEKELKKISSDVTQPDGIPEFAHEVVHTYGKPGADLLKDLGVKTSEAMYKVAALADTDTPLHKQFRAALAYKENAFKAAAAVKLLAAKIGTRV